MELLNLSSLNEYAMNIEIKSLDQQFEITQTETII